MQMTRSHQRIRVILDDPLGLLDYLVPEELVEQIALGTPIQVPLGNRHANGYVAQINPPNEDTQSAEFKLRPITTIDSTRPDLPENLIKLLLFGANYYALPCGELLRAALPAAARNRKKRYALTPEGELALSQKRLPTQARTLQYAQVHPNGFTATSLKRAHKLTGSSATNHLRRLVNKGWLKTVSPPKNGPRMVAAFRRLRHPQESAPKLSAQNQALLHSIPTLEPIAVSRLNKSIPGIYSRLKTLEKHKLVERTELPQSNNPYHFAVEADLPLAPTDEQKRAIQAVTENLQAGQSSTFLLHGVTGSGKTEVYLQVIAQCLALNKTALVLVPEIALTPQLGGRFRARFGNLVATFHSGLSPAERRDEWGRVRSKEAKIGLGARSALFLPLENIGIIIVDEEHETSFKQEESPRYNARDLAVARAQIEEATCILGSATPSLETRCNADSGRYQFLQLTQRVFDYPLPPVELLPLATTPRVGEGILTAPLLEAIENCVAQKEQTILFLNRRGFAPYVFCKDCGTPFRCPDCDVSLTLHQQRNCLLCHYCAYEMAIPIECPSCESPQVGSSGIGTERLEAELQSLIQGIRTIRIDRDTVRKRIDLEKSLNEFRTQEADVLIGTQMVAKGHDFPNVTLVGVITADSSLNFPDFRAGERTFQLLTQVAGRAGRTGKQSKVLIQAFEVNHYAMQCAIKHDYTRFLEQELAARQELNYPPYSHLALFRFESEDETLAFQHANEVAQRLCRRAEELGNTVTVLGPAPAALARLKGIWRIQVLLKSSSRSKLRQVIQKAGGKRLKGVRQILDVDPMSML